MRGTIHVLIVVLAISAGCGVGCGGNSSGNNQTPATAGHAVTAPQVAPSGTAAPAPAPAPAAPAPAPAPGSADAGTTPTVGAVDKNAPRRCDAAFPSAGTRFVHARTITFRVPKEAVDGTVIRAEEEKSTFRWLVEIEEAEGKSLKRASIMDADSDPENRGPYHVDLTVPSKDPYPPPQRRILEAMRKLALAKTLADVTGAVRSTFREDGGEGTLDLVAKPKRTEPWGEVTVYGATFSGTHQDSVVGKTRSALLKAQGELLLRAADGAFVELHLSGTAEIDVDLKKDRGPFKPTNHHRGTFQFDIVRECFRTAVVPVP